MAALVVFFFFLRNCQHELLLPLTIVGISPRPDQATGSGAVARFLTLCAKLLLAEQRSVLLNPLSLLDLAKTSSPAGQKQNVSGLKQSGGVSHSHNNNDNDTFSFKASVGLIPMI